MWVLKCPTYHNRRPLMQVHAEPTKADAGCIQPWEQAPGRVASRCEASATGSHGRLVASPSPVTISITYLQRITLTRSLSLWWDTNGANMVQPQDCPQEEFASGSQHWSPRVEMIAVSQSPTELKSKWVIEYSAL